MGLSPLYTSFADVWAAVDRIRQVVEEKRYRHYPWSVCRSPEYGHTPGTKAFLDHLGRACGAGGHCPGATAGAIIQQISFFVDEFVTAWAARNVLTRGLPIFPSGDFYPHGLIFTYLEAAVCRGGVQRDTGPASRA